MTFDDYVKHVFQRTQPRIRPPGESGSGGKVEDHDRIKKSET